MLITPEPELDFLMAIKTMVSSKAKHWQLPDKAYNKRNSGTFTKFSNNHPCHSQRPPLMGEVTLL